MSSESLYKRHTSGTEGGSSVRLVYWTFNLWPKDSKHSAVSLFHYTVCHVYNTNMTADIHIFVFSLFKRTFDVWLVDLTLNDMHMKCDGATLWTDHHWLVALRVVSVLNVTWFDSHLCGKYDFIEQRNKSQTSHFLLNLWKATHFLWQLRHVLRRTETKLSDMFFQWYWAIKCQKISMFGRHVHR